MSWASREGTPAPLGATWVAAEQAYNFALYSKSAERVTLLVRGEGLKASRVIQEKVQRHPQIDLRPQTEVVRFDGDKGKLKSVTVKNRQSGQTEVLHPAGVFVFVGQEPNTAFLAGSDIRIDRWGYIITGHNLLHEGDRPPGYEKREPSILETSVPGIFAAGDVRAGSTKQVASATGEGATAALLVREYLKTT